MNSKYGTIPPNASLGDMINMASRVLANRNNIVTGKDPAGLEFASELVPRMVGALGTGTTAENSVASMLINTALADMGTLQSNGNATGNMFNNKGMEDDGEAAKKIPDQKNFGHVGDTHFVDLMMNDTARFKVYDGTSGTSTDHRSAILGNSLFLRDDLFIIQTKGWGSNMTFKDFQDFTHPNLGIKKLKVDKATGQSHPVYHGLVAPTPDMAYLRRFIDQVRVIVQPTIDEYMRQNPSKRVLMQWDGDKVVVDGFFSTYAVFMYGVAAAVGPAKLEGFLCTKLADDEASAQAYMKTWDQFGGAALASAFETKAYVLAFPSTEYTKTRQKQTGYGFFGACMNRLIPGADKLILAFGGGDVLDQEENVGYTPETSIVPFDLTRNFGGGRSTFVSKGVRKRSATSPTVLGDLWK